MLDLAALGVDSIARGFVAELRDFRRVQLLKIREGLNVVRTAERAAIRSTFGQGDTQRFLDSAGKKVRGIAGKGSGGYRIRRPSAMARNVVTKLDSPVGSLNPFELVGRVQFGRLGFFAIHERGGIIRASGKGGLTHRAARSFRPYLLFVFPDGSWRFASQVRIPARPTWGPTADATRERVVGIAGESFDVFGPGA